MSRYTLENTVSFRGATYDIGQIIGMGMELFGDFADSSVAVVTSNSIIQLAAVTAAESLRMASLILPPERYMPDVIAQLDECVEYTWVDGDVLHTRGRESDEPGVILLTSGTTGPPKAIRHSFDSVDTQSGMKIDPERWICTYTPGTYAWFQVVMLALVVPGQSLAMPEATTGLDLYRTIVEEDVTAVPSTPSLWRFLLATVPRSELAALPIRRISLGGERADQAILDTLQVLYPDAKITHIFAATETGAAIVVSDGREGFPKMWLDRALMRGKVNIKIEDDTLRIKSPYSYLGRGEWIDTGDRVEVVGDRVLYRGRKGERTVNVGGTKVVCSVLEDHVLSLAGVRYARAYPKKAPLVGNLVALDVLRDDTMWPDPDEAERGIRESCRQHLPEGYEPRLVVFLDEVPLGPNLKSEVRSS